MQEATGWLYECDVCMLMPLYKGRSPSTLPKQGCTQLRQQQITPHTLSLAAFSSATCYLSCGEQRQGHRVASSVAQSHPTTRTNSARCL